MSYQSPNQVQSQVNAVPWTNGRNLVTGATVFALLTSIIALFLSYNPTAHSNTTLSTYATTSYSSVVRDGFAVAGDSPAVTYTPSATCPYNGGVANGGSCVASSDGKFWVIKMPLKADPAIWGAVGNGVTHDTTAFQNALNDAPSVVTPGGMTYLVNGLTLPSQHSLECQNSVLTNDSPSINSYAKLWVFKGVGNYITVNNCIVDDPSYTNEVSTTLTNNVTAGNYALPLASTTGVQCDMPLVVKLTSGAYFPTKSILTGCLSGNNLSIVDPIPNSVTGYTIVSGGTGCVVDGGSSAPSAVIAYGGSGVTPATFKVTSVTGGVIQSSGLTLETRGFYQTTPSNPVQLLPGAINPHCIGATANLVYNGGTTNGASTGGTVEMAFGEVAGDLGGYSNFQNITVEHGTACFGFYGTTPLTQPDVSDNHSNNRCNNFTLFGLIADVNTVTSAFTNFRLQGAAHGSSAFGAVGFYAPATGYAAGAVGGNTVDVLTVLGAEESIWIETANQPNNLTFGSDIIADGARDYEIVCAGCQLVHFTSAPWSAYTGATGQGYGLNVVETDWSSAGAANTPASQITLPGLKGGYAAADLYLNSDLGTPAINVGCFANNTQFGFWPVGYFGAINKFCRNFLQGSSGATTLAAGSNYYLGSGIGSSTSLSAVWQLTASADTVVKMCVSSSVSPGAAQSYTATLYDGVTATPITATIPAGSTSACYTGPYPYTFPAGDFSGVQIAPSAGAASATFQHVEAAE